MQIEDGEVPVGFEEIGRREADGDGAVSRDGGAAQDPELIERIGRKFRIEHGDGAETWEKSLCG